MTPKEKLLQAQQFLKNKQYDPARHLLETLPDNPTAQQWLAKLDEIAPKKNGLNDSLMQANLLIRQKKYHEARSILESLPNNPTAQQWLAKLNKMTATQQIEVKPAAYSTQKRQVQTLPDVSFQQNNMDSLFDSPAPEKNEMSREDKEKLAYVHQLVQKKKFDQAREILKSMPRNTLAVAMLNDLDEIGLKSSTSSKAAWGGAAVLSLTLKNRFVLRLLIRGGFLIIAMAGFTIYNFIRGDASYENESLKIAHSYDWEVVPVNDIELCTDKSYSCFYVIGTGTDDDFGMISFSKVPLRENQTLEAVDTYLWGKFIPGWEGQELPAKTMRIAGKEAISHEFQATYPDDVRHFMQIHLMNSPATAIEILLWARDAASFQHRYSEMMEILNSIEWK